MTIDSRQTQEMWAQRLIAPRRFELQNVRKSHPSELADGQALLRLKAAGICGSDLPYFLGHSMPEYSYHRPPGFPAHEIVGEVVAVKDARFIEGQRVVGHAKGAIGLQEFFVIDTNRIHAVEAEHLSDVHATVIQPMCTVLSALDRVPSFAGQRVGVIGLGPLGLLFTHALKRLGAGCVTGIDVIDRSDCAASFGIDELVTQESRRWTETLPEDQRPALIVDAAGHKPSIIADAIEAAAPGGHIYAFGLPEDDHYVIPFRKLFRKRLTLQGGTSSDWRTYLARAERYLLDHSELLPAYVTDIFHVDDAEQAYTLSSYPAAGRLKVAMTTNAS